jgi:hypothetical protein
VTDYKDILGWDVHKPSTRVDLYIASAVALGAGYLCCRFVTNSKLGRVLLTLRDAESRVRFLGYSVTGAKPFVFTLSAVLAGIAGALYVPEVGIINSERHRSLPRPVTHAVGRRGRSLLWCQSCVAPRQPHRKKGEVTYVPGRNGVGKTSLLRAIFGLQPIRAGRITWEGRVLNDLPPHERAAGWSWFCRAERSVPD